VVVAVAPQVLVQEREARPQLQAEQRALTSQLTTSWAQASRACPALRDAARVQADSPFLAAVRRV
jgi:hypothetical protein